MPRNPIKITKGKIGNDSNFISFSYDLTNTIRKIGSLVDRFEGVSPEENLKDVVQRLAEGCQRAVLKQYTSTYSQKPRAIAYRMRTRRSLEPMLDYIKVEQLDNVVHMQVTNPRMYPIGAYMRSSPVYYAFFQEEGTRYVSARGFLLSGVAYLDATARRSINAAFRRWVSRA